MSDFETLPIGTRERLERLERAAQQALEALLTPSGAQACSTCQNGPENEYCCRMEMWSAVDALRAALAQQDEPNAHGYASRLAVAIWDKHYKDTAPQWKPLDDLMGVLTQIDNMTSGLTLLAQQAEPKPMPPEQRQRWEELAAMPQQAEPLNLRDPAVQKRLATQWGYVPAAQAEPVEPVATLIAQRDALLEVVQKFVAWSEAERDHSGTTFWQRVEMCREVDALAHAAIKAVEAGA